VAVPVVDPQRRQAIQSALLAWGEAVRRDLPWRRTRDPWAILVSEVMLQQTQVTRVVPMWQAFMGHFPTPAACASAPLGAVITAWQGLGYNRRARNLHASAVQIVERHAGRMPDSLDALQALPGVGPYTARAVLAFAFEQNAAVVDTNATRFLSRAVAGQRLPSGRAQRLADAMLPAGQAWAWNQAVLDLGAMTCTSRAPACASCPLMAQCAWRGAWALDSLTVDPAIGSGSTGRQSTFDGSDRQGRGRLVAALARGPVDRADVAARMGWPDDPDRCARVAATVVADGLAVWEAGVLVLP